MRTRPKEKREMVKVPQGENKKAIHPYSDPRCASISVGWKVIFTCSTSFVEEYVSTGFERPPCANSPAPERRAATSGFSSRAPASPVEKTGCHIPMYPFVSRAPPPCLCPISLPLLVNSPWRVKRRRQRGCTCAPHICTR